MEPEQTLFMNYEFMQPPTEFLILPNRNVVAQSGKIEVFKTLERGAACPWPTIRQANFTSGDTGSAACHRTISSWLKRCEAAHGFCSLGKDSPLPSRVLDLGENSGTDADVIRLLETDTEKLGSYCCLSHRWIDGDTPTTTADNLQERLRGIDLPSLPLKYQDAIAVTRSIGIRYLWIDSLCILQEDKADWLKEAPRMADYYGNAYLTISAAMAVEKGQRIFSKASSGTGTINIANEDKFLYAVHYRLPLSHTSNPLHDRGWIFQEYMLSRRVLHFVKDEVIWECREATWCECGRVAEDFGGMLHVGPMTSSHQSFSYRKKRRFHGSLYLKPPPERLKNLWMELIHEYSGKHLTFGSDVFPALAGIVKEMQKQRKCGYYAGLWEDTLVSDLLWESEDEEWYPDGHLFPKPDKWRAPSWSWASSTAWINWPCCPIDSTSGEFTEQNLLGDIYISDIKADCKPIGDDPTMGFQSAELSITGVLSVAPLTLNDKKGYAVAEDAGDVSIALDHTLTADELVPPRFLRTLLITQLLVGGVDYLSLVLRPTDSAARTYERIGLMHHAERLPVLEEETTIIIV
ncbi:hypothetical protein ACN47E_008161 [Coniothyrium glycines]